MVEKLIPPSVFLGEEKMRESRTAFFNGKRNGRIS
jgi:hypothetical protein